MFLYAQKVHSHLKSVVKYLSNQLPQQRRCDLRADRRNPSKFPAWRSTVCSLGRSGRPGSLCGRAELGGSPSSHARGSVCTPSSVRRRSLFPFRTRSWSTGWGNPASAPLPASGLLSGPSTFHGLAGTRQHPKTGKTFNHFFILLLLNSKLPKCNPLSFPAPSLTRPLSHRWDAGDVQGSIERPIHC